MVLSRKYPYHGIPSWELVQMFYGGLTDNIKNIVNVTSGGVKKYVNESMKFMERHVSKVFLMMVEILMMEE